MKRVLSFLFAFSLFYCLPAQNPVFDWAKSIGGSSGDGGYKTVSDAAGNVYIMGNFWNTVDMDPGPGLFNITSAGQGDNFILKLDAAGNFIWAKQFGNSFNDNCTSMSIDNNGNLYLTGLYYATVDFDPGSAVFNLTCSTTGYAAFVLKLDAGGNFSWVKELIETEYGNAGAAVAATPAGDVYICGKFRGTGDFDPGPGVFTLSSTGTAEDIFISKLNINGDFIWAKQFAGAGGKACYSMCLDPLENIYITGTFYNTCDFDPGGTVFNLTANNSNGSGSSDTYIVKLDLGGNFVFAKQVSADYNDIGWGIAVDPAGTIVVTGEFSGTGDFDPGSGVFILNAGMNSDGYVMKLDNAGNFVWAKQFESTGNPFSSSRGFSVAIDNFGNIYSTGDFNGSVDFDPGATVHILSTPFLEDSYISKLDASGNFIFGLQLTGNNFTQSASLFTDAQRNITITGTYQGTTDFDPGAAVYNYSSVGSSDVFVMKLKQPCTLASTYTITAFACNQYTLNNQVYTSSGIYVQTLINAAGCDSIITLNLTIGGSTTTVSATSCDSYFWEGQTYTTSGTYTVNYIGTGGCDSILKLNLIIKKSVATSISASICEGQTYGGYSTSGIYTDIFTAANGCDSIRTLNLTVKSKSISSISTTICEGQMYEGYTTTGTYINTFVAANGCDSIRTLYLLVNPKKITTINAGICPGQTYTAGGASQTVSGIYYDTLRTYLNCDSVIITNLVVHPKPRPDLGADKDLCAGSVLTLNPGLYKSYLWQDMSTLSTFRTSTVGLYWVTVTDNNNCSAVDSVNINTVFQLPAGFLKQTDSLCTFDNLVIQPAKNYSDYFWSTGAVQKNITIQTPGKYWLQVTDENGCKGLDTITVIPKKCTAGVFIPTAFTPNGDGKNDFFKATVHGNLLFFKLSVFNRYGELVFQTSDPAKKWDGLFKGASFNTNTFVWECTFQLEGEQPDFQKGVLVLIR
jgi:gliding motility-associated-like protein